MLEGGDRTVGIGEGGLKMCQDLRCGPARSFRWEFGRRATCQQGRAEFALAQVEPFPDALPGPVTSPTVGDDATRSGDAVRNGRALQESPQRVGGHAQASDFVCAPDAEGPTAANSPMAIAAKNPPSADHFALGVAFVVPAQKAVPIQRANGLAMRARRLLESFSNRVPFRLAAAKPAMLAHDRRRSAKIANHTIAKSAG